MDKEEPTGITETKLLDNMGGIGDYPRRRGTP